MCISIFIQFMKFFLLLLAAKYVVSQLPDQESNLPLCSGSSES